MENKFYIMIMPSQQQSPIKTKYFNIVYAITFIVIYFSFNFKSILIYVFIAFNLNLN